MAIHRYGRVCQADFLADFVAGAAGKVFVVSGVSYGTGQVCVYQAEESARSVELDVGVAFGGV